MTETSIAPKSSVFPRWQITKWNSYLGLGVFLNAAIWALVLIYLKFAPHKYTSQWGVSVLGTDPGVEVILPDGGRAAPYPVAEKPRVQDLRLTFVYIATSPDILEKAAKQADISVKDFGKPKIKTEENSAIISFEMEGRSPTEASEKSQILYQVMAQHINDLRKAELERRQQENQGILQQARQQLNSAQNKLFNYNNSSPLSSSDQIRELVVNLEQLRNKQIDLLAQEQGLARRFQQLSTDLNLSSTEAVDGYKLLADQLFNLQLENYSNTNADLTILLSRFKPQHPTVVRKQAEMEMAAAALEKQASFILGRPVSQETLFKLKAKILSDDRKELFKELVINRSGQQELAAQKQEIERKIILADKRLKALARDQLTVNILNRDLHISEVFFTSTIAKLNLGKGNIDSIYPPIQLVSGPSLPEIDKPTAPNKGFAIVGGLAASFLVTTGLILLGSDKKRFQ